MDDHHRLDGVAAVGGELRLERRGIDAVAPVARHELDLEPVLLRHRLPQGRELAGLEASTLSPGDSVLRIAASHAPVPEVG